MRSIIYNKTAGKIFYVYLVLQLHNNISVQFMSEKFNKCNR